MVRMRAAENRRWILRSTNDGITATIDSAGRLRGTLPEYMEATSYTGFSYVAAQTVYTRFGDWFPLLCAMRAVLGLVATRGRGSSDGRHGSHLGSAANRRIILTICDPAAVEAAR